MFNAGIKGKKAADGQGTVSSQSQFVQSVDPQPSISGYTISGLDDTALDPAGGQTVLINGSGFASGISATLGGAQIGAVTLVNPTQISFTAPAKSPGSYTLVVYNASGGAAILVPGLSYSSFTSYTTAAGSLANYYETTPISNNVVATSDTTITYTLVGGTLPGNATLASNGYISGTSPVDSGSTTYTFDIKATDAELQDVTRTFTLTINTDVVTWSAPANSTEYTIIGGTPMANVTMSATSAAGYNVSYTANTLPTGLSISGSNITGTPTTQETITTLLTATAATTNRTATRIISWIVQVNDLYFKNTSLLLNGSTTVTPFIKDASANNYALTIVGDSKPTLFSPYEGSYYSNYFDGSGDYLTAPANTAFGLSTTNFTVECWVYALSFLSNSAIVDFRVSGAGGSQIKTTLQFVTNGVIQFKTSDTNRISTTGLSAKTWYHVALVKSSNVTKLYVNGVANETTYSDTNDYGSSNDIIIGQVGDNRSYGDGAFNGYISNLRVVKGTAVYTSNFTPSTTPLTAISGTSVLTCQSNRFIDNSTNNFTITRAGDVAVSPSVPFAADISYSTYGSTYFDGSSDGLSFTQDASWLASSTQFTAEAWFYFPGSTMPNDELILGQQTNGFVFYASASSQWQLGLQFTGVVLSTSTSIVPKQWTHVAITRDASNIIRIFVNGALAATSSADSRSFPAGTWNLANGASSKPLYLADFRLVSGTAVYTTAFTPPTTPLTAITNTKVLTCQYNGGATNYGIIDNGNFNNIVTRYGNTSQGTFSPYSQTGWSNYFNGTAGYITTASNTNNALGSGNYTIEFWCYSNSLGSGSAGSPFYVDSSGYQQLIRHNGGNWECYYASGLAFTSVSTSTVGLNQWVHHALVRSSGTVKWYINGIQRGSAANSTDFTAATFFQMGNYGSYIYDGYVSNVRVVKGTAVYTSAFTPPTAPLTPISGTIFLTAQSNTFIDNGPFNTALTITSIPQIQAFSPFGSISEATPISYSNYFDGTGDYLINGDNTNFELGSSNFTIEGWFSWSSNSGNWTLFYKESSYELKSDGNRWVWQINGASNIFVTSWTPNINQWYHIALVRNTTVTTLYIDGTSYTSGTSVNANDNVNALIICGNTSFNGYISNFRFVKGTAVYTSNFTPSTTPLTAISGTSLLTCQSTTMIDNSINAFTFSVTGNTVPKKYNPFGYTTQVYASYTPSLHGGSAYFDGTGDYLLVSHPTLFDQDVNFTIEMWLYTLNYPASNDAKVYHPNGSGTLAIALSTAGKINIDDQQTGNKIVSTATVRKNIWTHVALVRNGPSSSNLTLYINGVVDTTVSYSNWQSTTTQVEIGRRTDTATYYNGYISDLRVTKGVAVYTSSFVPPAQTLTNYSTTYPASLLLNFNNGGIIDKHSSNILEAIGNTQLSTAIKKYNNASIRLDGSGDYINIPYSQLFNFGTGDFTVECWVNISYVQYSGIISSMSSSITTEMWLLGFSNAARVMTFGMDSSGNAVCGADYTDYQNIWTHIAACRSGSTLKLFFNGTQVQSVTNSSNFTGDTANPVTIGRRYTEQANYYMNGYIDDLRITKGYARYTSNFTAPVSALVSR